MSGSTWLAPLCTGCRSNRCTRRFDAFFFCAFPSFLIRGHSRAARKDTKMQQSFQNPVLSGRANVHAVWVLYTSDTIECSGVDMEIRDVHCSHSAGACVPGSPANGNVIVRHPALARAFCPASWLSFRAALYISPRSWYGRASSHVGEPGSPREP